MNPVKEIRTFDIIATIFGLATMSLIILKILDVITWSWVWVFCPLWSLVIIIAIILIFIIIFTKNTYEDKCNNMNDGKYI